MSARYEREAAPAASPDLEVLWQRRLAAPYDRAALVRFAVEAEREILDQGDATGSVARDLVVTISRGSAASHEARGLGQPPG